MQHRRPNRWTGSVYRHGQRLHFETLEPRALLDAAGVLTGVDAHLTLSFAGDGTQIAGQSSGLAARFDAIAPTEQWQQVILRAFQTWAVHTNADIGVVDDGGQPFGTGGASQRDERFGDIRIGAIAMAPNTGGVSVPVDELVSGTWFADVVFNTAFDFQSLDDIYAVALHEAGNVFGLEDNDDPDSPLHTGMPLEVHLPTPSDITALQAMHGARAPDVNEASEGGGGDPGNNDTFANATELDLNETSSLISGSAPTIVYGDITAPADLDYFAIDVPGNYNGPTTIQLRSKGISLLEPRLRIFDGDQQLIDDVTSTAVDGDQLAIHLPTLANVDKLYLEVGGSAPDVFGTGGYSLVVTFDQRNEVDQATVDMIAGGAFRLLSADDINKFFDDEENDFYGEDLHTDDTGTLAGELSTTVGYVENSRYEVVASISDATDTDFYKIKSPVDAAQLDVMTVQLWALEAGGLVPQVHVFDGNQHTVDAKILANGGGELVVQVANVNPHDEYLVQVQAATPGTLFDTGNYHLVVSFVSRPTILNTLGAATIGGTQTQRVHTLYVGKPQLFHFLMSAENVPVTTPTGVLATILDDQGANVYQFATLPGETRSREAVLLEPGTYTVQVTAVTFDGTIAPEIEYQIEWLTISDPFVGDPSDPTSNPFACPGMPGFFCYPGDIVSPDPFLWSDFIDSLTDPLPTPDLRSLTTTLFGDWWSWVWTQFGVNGPAFAQGDTYHIAENSTLQTAGNFNDNQVSAVRVGPADGLLRNDVDPEGGEFIALIETGVSHGTLELSPDGGFTYTPDVGFTGIDSFTYTTFDFIDQSEPGLVKIVVGISGDFDASGAVTGIDFLAWQRGFGNSPGAELADGDADMDGVVAASDLTVWEAQFGNPQLNQLSNGDANGDGAVDGVDFLAWQRGFGLSTDATVADGDADSDGDVDATDLAAWQTNYGNQAPLGLLFAEPIVRTTALSSAVSTLGQSNARGDVAYSIDPSQSVYGRSIARIVVPAVDVPCVSEVASSRMKSIAHAEDVSRVRDIAFESLGGYSVRHMNNGAAALRAELADHACEALSDWSLRTGHFGLVTSDWSLRTGHFSDQ